MLIVAVVFAGAIGILRWTDSARPDHAQVLVLDPETGETENARTFDGSLAVAALLRDERVAVAWADACPDGEDGSVLVLDATLVRVTSTREAEPCAVARLTPRALRAQFESVPGDDGGAQDEPTVRLGSGTLERHGNRLTALDADGKTRWNRVQTDGSLASVDVRDDRIVVTVRPAAA